MKKIRLIVTLLMLAGTVSAQTPQEWRDSVSVLSRQITKAPYDTSLRLKKAACNIELGQWQYALDEYSYVLTLEPKNLEALYYRGYVNHHLGRYPFARKDYESVLAIDPMSAHALIGLIMTNLADGRITQAYDDANRLVNQMPDNAESYATRAEVEKSTGMVEAAIEDIEKAIEIEDVEVKKKYPTSVDDNITSYQLTAFTLYLQTHRKDKARGALEYLVANGVPRAALVDYYTLLGTK